MRSEIFAVLKRNLVEVLPELEGVEITEERSMREFGANSIDRMDVLIAAQDELGVTIPVQDFGSAHNLGSLVDIFARYVQGAAATPS